MCTPGFEPLAGHFKNKWCPQCRDQGITVEAARAFVLMPPDSVASYINPCSHGCWSYRDACWYRLINQTQKCKGPPMVLLQDASSVPRGFNLHPVPPSYLDASGRVHLTVSAGTLRHIPYTQQRKRPAPSVPAVPPILLPEALPLTILPHGISEYGLFSTAIAFPLDELVDEPSAPTPASVAASSDTVLVAPARAKAGLPTPKPSSWPDAGAVKRSLAEMQAAAMVLPTPAFAVAPPALPAPSAGTLLELATVQAQAASQIKRALDHASTDDVDGYRAALSKCVPPLAEASEALRQVSSFLASIEPTNHDAARAYPPPPEHGDPARAYFNPIASTRAAPSDEGTDEACPVSEQTESAPTSRTSTTPPPDTSHALALAAESPRLLARAHARDAAGTPPVDTSSWIDKYSAEYTTVPSSPTLEELDFLCM